MLSRSSSDAATCLRRSKSATSVQRTSNGIPIEHIDPELAAAQAHAAALAAYDQAHGHSSDPHPERDPRQRARRNTKSSEGSHLLAYRDSNKRLSTANNAKRGQHDARNPSRRQRSSVTGESAASSAGMQSLQPTRAGSDARSHAVGDAPSRSAPVTPQRRVRRAQSSVDFSDASASAHRQERLRAYVQNQHSVEYDPNEHLVQSVPEYVAGYEHKGLVERAFSSFIGQSPEEGACDDGQPEQSTEQIIRKRTSFMSVPLSRRGKHVVHEPIQTTTTSVTTSAYHSRPTTRISTESHLPAYDSTQIPKNRSTSTTLRSKIFRFFRKPSEPKEPLLLPQQQVTARRSHYSSDWESPPIVYGPPTPRWPDSAVATAETSRARTPSADLVQINASSRPRSREPSGASQKTATQTGSRVTSWTDSTDARTIGDKRLSVIDEHGYVESRTNTGLPDAELSPPSHAAPTSLLGRRIYDKLMRRQSEALAAASYEHLLDTAASHPSDNIGQVESENPAASAAPVLAVSEEPKPVQRHRKSSWGLRAAREAAASTIRAVTPSVATSRKASGSQDDADFNNEDITVPIEPLPIKYVDHRHDENHGKPSQEQIARRVAKHQGRWKAPLDAEAPSYAPISALDFATATTYAPLGATTNDIGSGLALAERPRNAQDVVGGFSFDPSRRSSSRGDCHGAVSPSIYSRATDESPAKSIFKESPKVTDSGSAVVLPSYRISSGSPQKRRSQHQPAHAATTSRDWRAWLSKELGELDRDSESEDLVALTADVIRVKDETKAERDRSYVQIRETETDLGTSTRATLPRYAKRSGHCREHAQISSESSADVSAELPTPKPLSGIDAEARVVAVVKNEEAGVFAEVKERTLSPVDRPRSVMNERFPMIETGRPQSRASQKRPTSSASEQRAAMATKPSAGLSREDLSIADRDRPVSRGAAGNLLTVPQNPLLSGRSRSMIPLRTQHPSTYGNAGDACLIERSHSPNQKATAESKDMTNISLRSTPTTPTIAVSSCSPARSARRLNLIPQIKPSSPFATASNSPRHFHSTQDLQSRNSVGAKPIAEHTPSYDRPASVVSLRRKPVPGRPALLEDTTIKIIYEGPYASTSKENLKRRDKENVALSTPPGLKMRRSFGGPANSSPSSGQRMADEWLRRRGTGAAYGAATARVPDWTSETTGSPAFI